MCVLRRRKASAPAEEFYFHMLPASPLLLWAALPEHRDPPPGRNSLLPSSVLGVVPALVPPPEPDHRAHTSTGIL